MFGFNFLNRNTVTKKLANGFEIAIDFDILTTKLTRNGSLVGSRMNNLINSIDGKKTPIFPLDIVDEFSTSLKGGQKLETTVFRTNSVCEIELKNVGTVVVFKELASVIVSNKTLFGYYNILTYSSGELVPLKVHGSQLKHLKKEGEDLYKFIMSLRHFIANMRVDNIETFYVRGKLHTYILATEVVNTID